MNDNNLPTQCFSSMYLPMTILPMMEDSPFFKFVLLCAYLKLFAATSDEIIDRRPERRECRSWFDTSALLVFSP